jgi:uncharacterized protein
MSPSSPSLPVSERIATLDIVRGFALMGILIMNIPYMAESQFAGYDGSVMWPGALDHAVEEFRETLLSGKFNSMFSFLFGLGFTLQYARMQRLDAASATRLYLRRLVVLLVIGIVHATVFWTGDILHFYAMLGLCLLLPLHRARIRTLLIVTGLLFMFPIAVNLVRLQVVTPDMTAQFMERQRDLLAGDDAAFGHGSFLDTWSQSTRQMRYFYSDSVAIWFCLRIYAGLGVTMMLGMIVGRLGWLPRLPELLPRIPRVQWTALVIGVVLAVMSTAIFESDRTPGPSMPRVVASIEYQTARLALSIFYVLTIVRIVQTPRGARWLAPFGAAGRMPLTNYLMQTAIGITLFYGWGLGLWNQVGTALQFVIALAIFWIVQVPWSLWYLRRHERGPLEALWARLTYGPPAGATPLKAT